ncbi:PilZ domain-containing protein, partial [bacterium]|nr:PilZ domain-containing protein [bacterium]
MQEKRKSGRLYEVISVRQRSQENQDIEVTQAKDISKGGLRIATDTRLDIGSKVNIEVSVPRSPRPYYTLGEVIWLKEAKNSEDKKFDMGVKFLRII